MNFSWWYNYLPVPDAEYKTPYWCTYEDGSKPTGLKLKY